MNVTLSNSRDRVVQICHPISPYIKKSFEGISMYELAGGFINNYVNYADPSNSVRRPSRYLDPHTAYVHWLLIHLKIYTLVWIYSMVGEVSEKPTVLMSTGRF
jgi:hypothetical protein